MFELGARLDFAWLARNRWLSVAAVGESLGAFFAIYAALLYAGFAPLLAGCAAAVGTATSPAVVMLVAQELRASGQITERMLLFTAVNCAVAFVALTLLLPLVHLEYRAGLALGAAAPVLRPVRRRAARLRRLPADAVARALAGQARGPAVRAAGRA